MSRYAISDLHGHLELFKEVKRQLNREDTLYILGDCADRGPKGWETLLWVLSDLRCHLILGNHELMLLDVIKKWRQGLEVADRKEVDEAIVWTPEYELLAINGGANTFWEYTNSILSTSDFWVKKIEGLPTDITITNSKVGRPLILTHAGFTPWRKPTDKEDLVWDRFHFFDKWLDEDSSIIIHGHTPNPLMYNDLTSDSHIIFPRYKESDFTALGKDAFGRDIWNMTYCGGHKICIDPGTIVTKRGILIDLDTLRQEIIEFDWEKDEHETV